jgi:hypothetical protein
MRQVPEASQRVLGGVAGNTSNTSSQRQAFGTGPKSVSACLARVHGVGAFGTGLACNTTDTTCRVLLATAPKSVEACFGCYGFNWWQLVSWSMLGPVS